MSGGGGQDEVVQKTELSGAAKKYEAPALEDAYNLYKAPGPNYFPNSTLADFTPEQLAGQAGIVARATNGSPLNAASGQYAQDVIGGGYLNAGNPFQSQMDDQIAARVASDASLNGRMGSNYQARALTEGLAAPRYANYAAERGLQQNMAQFAPTLAGQDYVDLAALMGVGQQRQQQAQQGINADIARWDYNENLPMAKNQQFLASLYGNPSRTMTGTQPGGPSTGQQVLGGLLGLGGIGLGFI